MEGKLYIDGNDAYSYYGVFVTESGFGELAAFPPLKAVPSNNWAEDDGEEFDVSSPVLDSCEMDINFAFHGINAKIDSFVALLSDKAYHEFDFREIGRVYRLRLVAESSLDLAGSLGLLALHFANDFPLKGYSYREPHSSIVIKDNTELDGRRLSDYGICLLQGSTAEIQKTPSVKENLLQNIQSKAGAIYDGEFVTFQTKEVKLNCLMRAATLEEFWNNYDALLFDLSRPKERQLYIDFTDCEYPCIYKSCKVESFCPTEKIWFQFSIILVFTSFRIGEEEYLLATEEGEYIVTEDEEYYIDTD